MIETTPSGTILHGRYRIERVLGSGGFGHVYLAIDLATSQQYAVKEYLVTGTSGQEQLTHESNVLGQLHHPNLPAFHDAFNERGRYYVVLNYIEGNDLTDLVRLARQHNEAIPIARIMDWLLGICDAVTFLHSQHPQVIHRDIKPDNIRITSDGTAVLVDLGNAKAAADGARTLFFIRHQGTPGYAPLEQYPGGSGTDARSDVYALGGTLYFALTAHEPPSVSTRQAVQAGQPDLPSLQQQLANNPPEDSANAVRAFRLGVTKPGKPAPRYSRHLAQLGTLAPEVLERLNIVIQRSMAMKPRERYQSVAEFASDLRIVRDALPMTTTTGVAHMPDTHSTQPDLPMLYETLQAAKERAETENAGSGVTSGTAGNVPSRQGQQVSYSMFCPRCNTPLTPQATFCPRCGASLTAPSPSPQNSQGASVSAGVENQVAHMQMQAKGDISSEQTLIIAPKKLGGSAPFSAPQGQQADQHRSASVSPMPPRSMPIGTPNASATPVRGVQGYPSNGITPQRQISQTGVDRSDANTSGTKIDMRLLFIMAVVVAILLIIMILLLSQMHHGGTGLIDNFRVLSNQLQRGFHERSFSRRALTTSSYSTARLR